METHCMSVTRLAFTNAAKVFPVRRLRSHILHHPHVKHLFTNYKIGNMDESEQNSQSAKIEVSHDSLPATSEVKKKQKKPGIIHLSYIPRYMTVKKVREYFSEFGEVRRLFLKPEKPKSGKPSKFFSEGWVEFTKRKIARQVAECLNGTQVGGRRHTPYYDALWCIKYLPGFQWGHLSEAKAYEKSRKEQTMRAEIAKAKKEIDSYSHNASRRKRFKKVKSLDDLEVSKDDILPMPQTSTSSSNERKSSVFRRLI